MRKIRSLLILAALLSISSFAHADFFDDEFERESARNSKNNICYRVLSGELEAQKSDIKPQTEIKSLKRLWKDYERGDYQALGEFARSQISDQTAKDLQPSLVAENLAEQRMFRRDRLKTRMTYELANPLTQLSDIRSRQAELLHILQNPSIMQAFEAVEDAIHELDMLAMATYGDPRADAILDSASGYRAISREASEKAVAKDGGFLMGLSDLFVEDRFMGLSLGRMSHPASGLSLFFMGHNRLKGLFGYKQEHIAIVEKFRAANLTLLETLKSAEGPTLRKVRRILELMLGVEQLQIQEQKRTLLQVLRPSNYRDIQFSANYSSSNNRLNVMVASLMAFDELNLLFTVSRPLVHCPQEFIMPEFVNRDAPYLELVDGHHPYVFAKNKEKSVSNDILLDGSLSSGPRTYMLVGPNRRGKTTYMQMTGMYILMARAGIFPVPARSFKLSDLHVISALNMSGNIQSSESLFSSQARAAMAAHQTLSNAGDTHYFYLMDEAFHGTTPGQQLAILQEYVADLQRTRQIGIITVQNPEIQRDQILGVQNIHNTRDFKIVMGAATEEDRNAPEVLKESGFSDDFVNRVNQRIDANKRNFKGRRK